MAPGPRIILRKISTLLLIQPGLLPDSQSGNESRSHHPFLYSHNLQVTIRKSQSRSVEMKSLISRMLAVTLAAATVFSPSAPVAAYAAGQTAQEQSVESSGETGTETPSGNGGTEETGTSIGNSGFADTESAGADERSGDTGSTAEEEQPSDPGAVPQISRRERKMIPEIALSCRNRLMPSQILILPKKKHLKALVHLCRRSRNREKRQKPV